MSWNYRVIHSVADGQDAYQIHEVYYRDDVVEKWTTEAVEPFGETAEELRGDYEMMGRAFELPVLEKADLPRG